MPHPRDAARIRKRDLIRQRLLRRRRAEKQDPKKTKIQIAIVMVVLLGIIISAYYLSR